MARNDEKDARVPAMSSAPAVTDIANRSAKTQTREDERILAGQRAAPFISAVKAVGDAVLPNAPKTGIRMVEGANKPLTVPQGTGIMNPTPTKDTGWSGGVDLPSLPAYTKKAALMGGVAGASMGPMPFNVPLAMAGTKLGGMIDSSQSTAPTTIPVASQQPNFVTDTQRWADDTIKSLNSIPAASANPAAISPAARPVKAKAPSSATSIEAGKQYDFDGNSRPVVTDIANAGPIDKGTVTSIHNKDGSVYVAPNALKVQAYNDATGTMYPAEYLTAPAPASAAPTVTPAVVTPTAQSKSPQFDPNMKTPEGVTVPWEIQKSNADYFAKQRVEIGQKGYGGQAAWDAAAEIRADRGPLSRSEADRERYIANNFNRPPLAVR